MKTVQLSEKEDEVLKSVLEEAISDLRAEIAQTDSPFFKDDLREKKTVMIEILDKVKSE